MISFLLEKAVTKYFIKADFFRKLFIMKACMKLERNSHSSDVLVKESVYFHYFAIIYL